MTKILKYLLLGIGIVSAVVVALAAYVSLTFNPNDYKPQIVKLVKDELNRTLRIDGDIKLTLYPVLGADLGALSLSERASEKEFAGVKSAQVSLQLMPLLSRELVVSRIEVRGLRANVVKRKNGETNLDDLLGREAAGRQQAKETAATPAKGAILFNIDHVLVEDASLSYLDEGSGERVTLDRLMLKTGRIVPGAASDIELALALGSNQPKAKVDIRLKTRVTVAAGGGQVKLEGLGLNVNGAAAGFDPLVLKLSGDVEGGKQVIKSPGVVLEFDGNQAGKSIRGKLASPFSADLDAHTIELTKIVADLALADAKSAPSPTAVSVTGSARADIPKQRVSLDFSAKIDESTVAGKAGLVGFSPPSYSFDLNVDKLDVDRYAGRSEPASQGAAGGKGQTDAAVPLPDLSALKTLRARGSIKVGALKLANLKAQNLRLEVKAGGGRLELDPLTASLYQGTLSGRASVVAATAPQIALKQNLVGISIGPLLKDAADKDIVEGRGNVTLDLSAQGPTVSAIRKALNGSAAISLADGALKGINIAAAIRDAKAKLGALKGEKSIASSAAEKTDFTELKASFAIKNGIAHNSDLSMKSPLLRLGGQGNIDLGAGSMDYLAKATLVATAAGQGGKNAAELKGITVPVRISGPFATLSYKLDFNAMASEAVRQKVEVKKEEIKAKVQDRLKDQLKGLFGR